jgi:hypothetical protein
MKKRIIKEKEHVVYDTIDELRQVMPNKKVYDDWRSAPLYSWVLTDDEQVCQILDKGLLQKHPYIRTAIGMFHCVPSQKIEGDLRNNIYNFSGKHAEQQVYDRVNPTKQEYLFARYVAKGDGIVESFKQAFPKADSEDYIKKRSTLLLKTERIKKLIDKEIQKILEETEITPKYLLLKTKEIVDNEEARDGDKISSLKMLMEIAGMLGKKEQKTESLTLFKGFSEKQLNLLEGKDVKQIATQTRQVHDMPETD